MRGGERKRVTSREKKHREEEEGTVERRGRGRYEEEGNVGRRERRRATSGGGRKGRRDEKRNIGRRNRSGGGEGTVGMREGKEEDRRRKLREEEDMKRGSRRESWVGITVVGFGSDWESSLRGLTHVRRHGSLRPSPDDVPSKRRGRHRESTTPRHRFLGVFFRVLDTGSRNT